jgi:uncharacterized protein (DUF1810 family)
MLKELAMSEPDLKRFLDAQDAIFDGVLEELANGCKRSHWMWFIFPILKGLGRSRRAVYYALDNSEEAETYLKHHVLGERLRQCVRLMLDHRGKSAVKILGGTDAWKFHQCLKLFLEIAVTKSDKALFNEALDTFYNT